MALISTCILVSCQSEPVIHAAPIAKEVAPKSPSNESIRETSIDLFAEAKMNALLDLINGNKMSLIKECPMNRGLVYFSSGNFQVEGLRCEIDKVKVYMGSSEIEYKLNNCQTNGKTIDNQTYVFGALSESEFQLINSNEEKQPLYACAK